MKKTNINGLDRFGLESFVASLGEKSFRAQQLYSWMYEKGVKDFDEMTNLSKPLRSKLNEAATISRLKLSRQQVSQKDQTTKFLFELDDGQKIESVLILHLGRSTICISTQVGCAIDCKFCATGAMGLTRNLNAGEIIDQVTMVQEITGEKISNIVCMGMGEPFHNYDNLMTACEILSDDVGMSFAKRHIVVSTSGLIPKIRQFTEEKRKFRLAISLNATTDSVREKLMPLNKKWPIRELIESVRAYTAATKKRVTFEYVLLNGVNDSVEDAKRLKKLVGHLSCKINLIPYNATFGEYKRSTDSNIQKFYEEMAGLKVPVTVRWSRGDDIDAGCGQLATKVG